MVRGGTLAIDARYKILEKPMVLKICTLPSRENLSFAINLIHLNSFYSITEVSIVGQLTVITMMTA